MFWHLFSCDVMGGGNLLIINCLHVLVLYAEHILHTAMHF